MASVNKCPYCGADVRSDEKNCPGCGAPNELYVTEAPAADSLRPKTMEELLDFAAERHMPLERMRFFVGKDYREPKAFGVYRDASGNYIVYKNKANGERAVRYSGPDEARAVGELYDKLLAECHNRHLYPEEVPGRSSHSGSHSGSSIHYDPSSVSSRSGSSSRGRQSSFDPKIVFFVFVLLFMLFFSKGCSLSLRGSSGGGYSSDYGYYDSDDSYSSWDDDDDDWDDWDDSDTDWDSDW